MRSAKLLIFLAFSVFFSGIFPVSAHAYVRFNNENWFSLPHPVVASFTMGPAGDWSGTTADGRTFLQYAIPNHYGIRVERFELDDHYHYIVEGEIVDSFTEFSQLLALAYEQSITG